jgi:predicted nucleotidyltransferase
MTTEHDIAEYLAGYPDIRLAILFGSLARGRARAHSDLDLAVAGSHPLLAQEKRTLIEGLALIAGRPVDLIDLRSVDGLILARVITTGKIIVCADRALYAALIKKVLFNDADMMPYHRRILGERRKAWIGT